jgi:hypothetical protein
MPILQYRPEEKERFKAYSIVMFGCREACRRLLEETSALQAAAGSLADRDRRQLGSRQPSPPHGIRDVVLGGTVGPHVYAAGEYLGAVSALYAADSICQSAPSRAERSANRRSTQLAGRSMRSTRFGASRPDCALADTRLNVKPCGGALVGVLRLQRQLPTSC